MCYQIYFDIKNDKLCYQIRSLLFAFVFNGSLEQKAGEHQKPSAGCWWKRNSVLRSRGFGAAEWRWTVGPDEGADTLARNVQASCNSSSNSINTLQQQQQQQQHQQQQQQRRRQKRQLLTTYYLMLTSYY